LIAYLVGGLVLGAVLLAIFFGVVKC